MVLMLRFRSILNLLLLLLVCVSSEEAGGVLSTGEDVQVFVADQIAQNDVSF